MVSHISDLCPISSGISEHPLESEPMFYLHAQTDGKLNISLERSSNVSHLFEVGDTPTGLLASSLPLNDPCNGADNN
jgi:hypothetical protein